MKKVIIDLNVIIDFLNKRDNHKAAAEIIELCLSNKIKGYVCAHEITTLSYFLFKYRNDHNIVKQVIMSILDIFSTIPITVVILREAINSNIIDFEDAVIEVSGIKENIDFIITRNINDFKKSRINAITPGEFLTTYFR